MGKQIDINMLVQPKNFFVFYILLFKRNVYFDGRKKEFLGNKVSEVYSWDCYDYCR